MPRKPTPRPDPLEGTQLSELQLAILRVLWADPGATVLDVHAVLARTRTLTTSTVSTVLTRLEERGLVRRTKDGRQFRHHATVAEDEAAGRMVDELARRVFDGDAAALVCRLLETAAFAPDELARIEQRIEQERRRLARSRRAAGKEKRS